MLQRVNMDLNKELWKQVGIKCIELDMQKKEFVEMALKELLKTKEELKMKETTYTVTVESKERYDPEYEVNFDNENESIEQAKKWAKEHNENSVFITFNRSSDGQEGYINRDGAGITGKSWT